MCVCVCVFPLSARARSIGKYMCKAVFDSMYFLCLIIATGFGACMLLGYTEAIPATEQKRRRGKQHLATGMDFHPSFDCNFMFFSLSASWTLKRHLSLEQESHVS